MSNPYLGNSWHINLFLKLITNQNGLLITIYLVGLVIAIWRASIAFYSFKLMKRKFSHQYLQSDVIRYVILKTVFWPFYIFAEKVLLFDCPRHFLNVTGIKRIITTVPAA
ncbi:hypothetical protein [Legionella micdadei]|uniref:hypothetical protein n=1 Tax=Legionella micdadei TaxID=451 RepID=UPI0009EF7B69|nr:hypothetical protein [Legionella micdadei]ARH01031.1 hypothetical protein B6V88_11770 [Legionella micdadei]